jgi:probable F420-dependent oxidoreductase
MTFRFAITAPSLRLPMAEWLTDVRRLEEVGFDEVVVADHFTDGYDTEPMVALTAASTATNRLRLRPAVLGVDYRHPVLVHRMAAALDVVSQGRLTLGIGSGWMVSDYAAAGITLDPPGVRVDRLDEAITIVKGLFGPDPLSFSGEHYEIRELDGLPKPVQRPHPPFFVGGGSRRVLRLAGREAAIVGVNASLRAGVLGRHAIVDLAPDRVREKIAWVHAGARESGRDPGDITLSVNCWLVRVTPDAHAARDFLDRIAGQFDLTAADLDASPAVLVGTVDRVCEKLEASRRDYGFTHVQLDAGFHPKLLDPILPVVANLGEQFARARRTSES